MHVDYVLLDLDHGRAALPYFNLVETLARSEPARFARNSQPRRARPAHVRIAVALQAHVAVRGTRQAVSSRP
jgi:hypothetical protein